jgi:hypothetical protein
MSVVVDNVEYDFIVNPAYGKYLPSIQSPKVTFTAENGYTHQREAYSVHTKKIGLEWDMLTEPEFNMLKAFIEYIGSESFWYVIPTSLRPRPDGNIVPKGVLCRISDTEIPENPSGPANYWHCKITLESIGGEWE